MSDSQDEVVFLKSCVSHRSDRTHTLGRIDKDLDLWAAAGFGSRYNRENSSTRANYSTLIGSPISQQI